jgi:hypothetical protein
MGAADEIPKGRGLGMGPPLHLADQSHSQFLAALASLPEYHLGRLSMVQRLRN